MSKINKGNSVCERTLVDSTLLVGWQTDRSSSVIKKLVLKLMDRSVCVRLKPADCAWIQVTVGVRKRFLINA